MDGHVVGLNTFILTQSGGSEGLGFAIPARVVSFVYRSLHKYGHVHHVEIGAGAQEISQTLASVRVWDRKLRGIRTFAAADCGFGYRTSRFKADPGRHVVLEVTFQFRQGELGAPATYAELAGTLGVEPGTRAPMADVRRAVLELAARGMVLDAADHDTWSAGSFFTNPVVPVDRCPRRARVAAVRRRGETSAAWLIERAGFGKGYGEAPRNCPPSTPWP
jgi:UDP-N-acetylmuramate dehydrogenase